MNLNSILIGSENPQRLADFYKKLFGEPSWSDGGYIGWLIGSGSVTVGPHDKVTGQNPQPGRIIWNIETPDVKGNFERFKSAGATVVAEPYGMGDSPDEAPDRDVRRSGRQLLPAHEPDAGGGSRLTDAGAARSPRPTVSVLARSARAAP